MFSPKYTITERLLGNVKKISLLVEKLNSRHFSEVILMGLEKTAREVSANASTSIEGNPLSLTAVKQVLKNTPSNIRDSEREVVNYNSALKSINSKLSGGNLDFTLDTILDVHRRIMVKLLPKEELGLLRLHPVLVNDPRTGQVVYLPPEVEEVGGLMNDLVEFVKKSKGRIDPLILAGIFHKQFVLIHPFMDGNGRTGRLLTKILLAQMGLDTFNLFSFENYYNKNVTKYFLIVGERGNYYDLAGNIDFTNWLEFFTEGIIDELLRVEKILSGTAQKPEIKLLDTHLMIIKHIQEHGSITDGEYAKLTGRAKATRTLDFKKLLGLNLLERKGKGKATFYILKSSKYIS